MKSKTVEERARRLLDSLGPLEYTKEAVAMRWIEADLRAVRREALEEAREEIAAHPEDHILLSNVNFGLIGIDRARDRIRALAEKEH